MTKPLNPAVQAWLEQVKQKQTQNQTQNTSTHKTIILDEIQRKACDMLVEGKSFVLTGAAGTGKTTTINAALRALLEKRELPMVSFRDPTGGIRDQEVKPAIAIVGYTNRAVNNLASKLAASDPELYSQLGRNIMTIHKLLEYGPEFYTAVNERGETIHKMHFIPHRHAYNKLPIDILIIEEASMLDLRLWNELKAALKTNVQIVFIGDINQLKPVFGDSILLFAYKDLPIVQLQKVYRQALESPIINAAYEVLNRRIPVNKNNPAIKSEFKIARFAQAVGPYKAMRAVIAQLRKLYVAKQYNPDEDIVLSAFNKRDAGTIMLNNQIAQMLDDWHAEQGNPRTIYEVIAGFNKKYLAVGDRVYYNKMDGKIVGIHRNGMYFGKSPLEPSTSLTRFGVYADAVTQDHLEFATDGYEIDIDKLFSETPDTDDDMRVKQASHSIEIELENGEVVVASTAGEVNALDLGYALTTHKAQGCEFEQVFVLLHDSHTLVASNEWLYTAITRAKRNCYIFCTEQAIRRVVQRKQFTAHTIEDIKNEFASEIEAKLSKLPEAERRKFHNLWPWSKE